MTAWEEIENLDAELGVNPELACRVHGTMNRYKMYRESLHRRRLELVGRAATYPGEFSGDLRRKAAAWHEAGHCYLLLVTGAPDFRGAWIGPARGLKVGDGWTEHTERGLGITKRALVLVAGPAAEKHFTGLSRGDAGDEAAFVAMLNELPADERDQFEAEVVNGAAAWIRDDEADIERIADLLLSQGDVTADQIRALFPASLFPAVGGG